MGYQLEISALTTNAQTGRQNLRTILAGNPTKAHWRPILSELGIDEAEDSDGSWSNVDASAFNEIDVERLAADHNIPAELLSEIVELRADLAAYPGTANFFARLTA